MSASRIRADETVKNWNSKFPIGTKALHRGVKVKTESWAGRNKHGEPSVFVSGTEEPVPLSELEVPGYTVKIGKRRTNERPSGPERGRDGAE